MDAHESCGDRVFFFHLVCLFPGGSTPRHTACAPRLPPRGRQGQLNQRWGATSETQTAIITFVYTVCNDGRQLNDPLLQLCVSFLPQFSHIRTPRALHANSAGHAGVGGSEKHREHFIRNFSIFESPPAVAGLLQLILHMPVFFLWSSVVELNLGTMP